MDAMFTVLIIPIHGADVGVGIVCVEERIVVNPPNSTNTPISTHSHYPR